MAQQQEIVQVKVDAEQQHKNSDNDLKIGVLVCADAEGFAAEPAGTGRAEGMDQRVKQRHTARAQQHDFHHGQHKIDLIQNFGAVPQFAGDLAHRGAGDLGAHQVHGAAVGHGQHGHGEHQHAHTAHPVGKAAPEQQAVAHAFDIGQNRRTGGGKAGNDLEKGVDEGWDLPRQYERESAEHRHQHPGQRHDGQAVTRIDGGVLRCAAPQQRAEKA